MYNYSQHLHSPALLLDHSIQLQTFNTLQKDLQSYINSNNNQIMPYLDHVNALLHQAVATCKAAIQVSKLPELLVKKENMPPGKSLDHQWRFVKTTKTPGRKRNGNILRYSYYIIHRNGNSKIRYLILIKACWLWKQKLFTSLQMIKMKYVQTCGVWCCIYVQIVTHLSIT